MKEMAKHRQFQRVPARRPCLRRRSRFCIEDQLMRDRGTSTCDWWVSPTSADRWRTRRRDEVGGQELKALAVSVPFDAAGARV